MNTCVEIFESLNYRIRMFGLPIDGSANMFCDKETVYKNNNPTEPILKKKHHSID